MPTAAFWIDTLGLQPHPEGGFFAETYRAAHLVAGTTGATRTAATAIYFLLRGTDVSALHRITADEGWHFYAGSPLTLHLLAPDGTYATRHLGLDVAAGQRPQHHVPAHHWFGATVDDPDGYTLVGCTVAPGFDFADFTLAQRDTLTAQFPQHLDLIHRLTKG